MDKWGEHRIFARLLRRSDGIGLLPTVDPSRGDVEAEKSDHKSTHPLVSKPRVLGLLIPKSVEMTFGPHIDVPAG